MTPFPVQTVVWKTSQPCFLIALKYCSCENGNISQTNFYRPIQTIQTPRYFRSGDVCPCTACGLFSRPTDINGQKVVLRQLLAGLLWYKQRSGAFVDLSTMMLSNRHWLNVYLLVSLQQHSKVEGLLGLNLTHSYTTTKTEQMLFQCVRRETVH